MRRTTFALLLSLMLHLSMLVFLYDGMAEKEKPSTPKRPVSLRINTVVAKIEEPEHHFSPTSDEVPLKEPLPQIARELAPLKKNPKKEKLSKPSSVQVFADNNASLPDEVTLLQTNPLEMSVSQAEKPSYLELHKDEIVEALQRAKSYPELARKRSIEGVVEVSFTIKPTGEVEDVDAISKSKLLSTAAIESVHKAKAHFPHPLENVTIKIPIIYIMK